MAVSAATVWEIRANGASINGGGFVAGSGGTDYSQQNAAQYTFSDLASSNGTTSPATVTSASHTFVAADVGNIMQISGGTSWTKGFYQIVSVAGGAATLDRACGSAATLSAGTYAVGGALKLANASYPDATWSQNVQAGNIVWFKNDGTHTPYTFTITSGTATSPIQILGYNAARGDNPTGSNRPFLNVAVNTVNFGQYTTIKNLIGDSLAGTPSGIFATNSHCVMVNIKATNQIASAGYYAISPGTDCVLFNCEAASTNGNAISTGGANTVLHGCYLHSSVVGFYAQGGGQNSTLLNTIISGNSTAAIQYTGSPSVLRQNVINCTLYGAETPTGTGILVAAGYASLNFVNNIIYGFSTGISLTDTTQNGFGDFNNFFNNTTDVTNWAKGSNSTALNPNFVNAASGNFAVGTNMKATAFPGTFPLTSTVGYMDMGAVQRKEDYPVAGNVRSGTSYGNSSLTGTLAVPTASQVLSGVAVDATTGNVALPQAAQVQTGVAFGASSASTGTYDGSDRWSDPGASNVRSGTAYKANSTTNNKTGSLDLPATSNVKIGVAFDGLSQTGTYDGSDRWSDPGTANVRSGTAYKANSTTNNKTGTCFVPTAAQVLSGVNVDNTTGSVDLPATGSVKLGITYGAADGQTGTYDGSDRWSDPGIDNVRSGTSYKANSTTNNKTGDLALPATTDVRSGVTFGSNNTLTGTLNTNSTDPGQGNVKAGVGYNINGVALTGTLTSTDPGVSNVKTGVSYEIESVSKTGTLGAAVAPETGIISSLLTPV